MNILEVAKLLNALDISFIKPHLKEDAHYFIEDFKKSLDCFNNPTKDSTAHKYSASEIFDKNLSDLLQATKNLFNILTDEGKKIIEEQLEKKENP